MGPICVELVKNGQFCPFCLCTRLPASCMQSFTWQTSTQEQFQRADPFCLFVSARVYTAKILCSTHISIFIFYPFCIHSDRFTSQRWDRFGSEVDTNLTFSLSSSFAFVRCKPRPAHLPSTHPPIYLLFLSTAAHRRR